MTVKAARGAKAKADRLFSQLIRLRGKCERCGRTDGPFDTAHVIGRRFSATRSWETNAWCLCRTCHWTVDNYADEKMSLVARTIGMDAYAGLRDRAESIKGQRFDWPAEVERLQALLKAAA